MGNVGPASYGKIKISNKAPPGTMNFAKRCGTNLLCVTKFYCLEVDVPDIG